MQKPALLAWVTLTAVLGCRISLAQTEHSFTVTSAAGEPVQLESAVSLAPLKIVHQSSGLRHSAGPSGANIDVLVVPKNTSLVIEKMSVLIKFEPISMSADPVGIEDVMVRFRDHEVIAVGESRAIPTSSRTRPPDSNSGIPASTTSEGTASEKVVLDPGSLISLQYKILGDTDSLGEATLTLLGHIVPVDNDLSDHGSLDHLKRSLTVTNTVGEPVRLESAVPLAPLKIIYQSSGLHHSDGPSGATIDALTVPKNASLAIEKMSVLIQFEPTSMSAGPVGIEDVMVRFGAPKVIEARESRAIPTSTSTRRPDSFRGIKASTTSMGTTSERIVLDPGSVISLEYRILGATDSLGAARLTLLGHVVPADSHLSDK